MAPTGSGNQKDGRRGRDANDETPESFGLTLSAIQVSRSPAPVAGKKAARSRRTAESDRRERSD